MRDEAPLHVAGVRSARMETLMALRGPDLLRVKGLLNVAGLPRAGGGAVGAAPGPSAGRTRGLAGRGPHAAALVFITRDITEQQVRDLLARCGRCDVGRTR